ncbi:MAG: hypothetical protein JJT75_11085, partial [Opitutales bacterium]|nr:hypothetical protein [Opitutales bacterium]
PPLREASLLANRSVRKRRSRQRLEKAARACRTPRCLRHGGRLMVCRAGLSDGEAVLGLRQPCWRFP